MPWRSQCGALTLALFLTAPIQSAPAAGAGSVDCWLLDGEALTQARESGWCKDWRLYTSPSPRDRTRN
ncbi:hypothetical protein GAY33_27915, partial [Azospirillum brasilense]|nr:hypothetical protein [Azospirillum argentinense]